MVEERITRVETPTGDTHTHTTVVDDGARTGGGSGWLIALILVLAVIAGIYLFSREADGEAAKDNAVAEAAADVGDAANKVGAAADRAVDDIAN